MIVRKRGKSTWKRGEAHQRFSSYENCDSATTSCPVPRPAVRVLIPSSGLLRTALPSGRVDTESRGGRVRPAGAPSAHPTTRARSSGAAEGAAANTPEPRRNQGQRNNEGNVLSQWCD